MQRLKAKHALIKTWLLIYTIMLGKHVISLSSGIKNMGFKPHVTGRFNAQVILINASVQTYSPKPIARFMKSSMKQPLTSTPITDPIRQKLLVLKIKGLKKNLIFFSN